MALGATVCKAFIDVSDIDRGYYESRSITIAQHPSETPARMMVRLLAWVLFAGDVWLPVIHSSLLCRYE